MQDVISSSLRLCYTDNNPRLLRRRANHRLQEHHHLTEPQFSRLHNCCEKSHGSGSRRDINVHSKTDALRQHLPEVREKHSSSIVLLFHIWEAIGIHHAFQSEALDSMCIPMQCSRYPIIVICKIRTLIMTTWHYLKCYQREISRDFVHSNLWKDWQKTSKAGHTWREYGWLLFTLIVMFVGDSTSFRYFLGYCSALLRLPWRLNQDHLPHLTSNSSLYII